MSGMRRREFITLLGGAAAAWPLAARAQQPQRLRRIGVLMNTSEADPETPVRLAAFLRGLESAGWKAGQNIHVDYRWGMGDVARTRAAVAELLALNPDVVLANATTATKAFQQASAAVPVVFVGVSEPVAQGLVQSLARPGGNMTGFTNLEPTIGAKWVDLLKEMAPSTKRLSVMFNAKNAPNAELFAEAIRLAGQAFSMESRILAINDAAEIEPGLKMFGGEPHGALVLPPDTFTTFHRKQIVDLARHYGVPAISAFRHITVDGGLASYGTTDIADQFRQAANYVDRILRGEKAGELPVQQPTRFELVINLLTARALGLDIPPTLLARADEVIE
jgi:putative tryptophan/tyrosine transport system substrate-binding protein